MLLCDVLQNSTKAFLGMRFTIPTPPRELLEVFLQKVGICVPLHPFKLVFGSIPIAFRTLSVRSSDWIHEINPMVYSEVLQA